MRFPSLEKEKKLSRTASNVYKNRRRTVMELTHAERIFSDIGSMVKEIKAYFRDLDSENIGSEMYADRIAKELGARIENLNGVIQTTLLTYLDKDARKRSPTGCRWIKIGITIAKSAIKSHPALMSRVLFARNFAKKIYPDCLWCCRCWRHLSRCCSYPLFTLARLLSLSQRACSFCFPASSISTIRRRP